MMAKMTGEGGRGGSRAGSPPLGGTRALIWSGGVSRRPLAPSRSSEAHSHRKKKQKHKSTWAGLRFLLEEPSGLERFQPVLPSSERWDRCAGHIPSSPFSAGSARS